MLIGLGVVAQLAIVVHAPDTVRACEAIDLTVAVSASASDMPRLITPSLRPFDVLRGAPSPRVTYRSGSRSSIVAEYRYVITTEQVGRFIIPPFEVRSRAGSVESPPTTISVLPLRARGAPSVVARARIDTGAGLTMRASSADTVFVGQQATYEVAVFLNEAARYRLRRNPTFYPPEMQAMLAYDLPQSAQGFRQHSGSQCFDALVYRRAVFPLVAGRLVIPPAQLVYSTGLSPTSLFSREESHELQTDSVSIVAVDPPLAGRPADFVGAVGEVRVDSRVDSIGSRVGDPLLYTVRVTGSGNVKLFPRPNVAIPWAGLVAADERVTVDSGSARVSGVKEFDWVLTPRIAGEFDVPPVRYGYFNPGSRRYETATALGDRLLVAAGTLASIDTAQAEGPMSIRTSWGGPASDPPQSSPIFWLTLALVPIPALVSRARRRDVRVTALAEPDPVRALAMAAASQDPVALRRHYVRALAQRLGASPADFTNAGALERALRRAGVSEATAARAESQLRELDAAAYSPTGALGPNAAKRASDLARAVDSEALSRSELPFWIPVLLLAVALGGAAFAAPALSAANVNTASSSFASGVSSYLRRDYAVARDAFADAVDLEPRSANAWANYGTAAWAAGDTASAIHGWREALALEPNANELHARTSLVRPLEFGTPGWVPSLPPNALVWTFAVLWLLAWTLGWIWRSQPGTLSRVVSPLSALSLVLGLIAMEVGAKVTGKDAAIVRRSLSLTSDPAVGMDRGPLVGTGEIVRVAVRRGAWVRVVASDDREGWIPAAELTFVADRRISRD
jgi:tetratricopeptide (TPR) repeat protein